MPTSLALDEVLDQSIGSVRYNGFYFPPARKSTIDFHPEYSNDGRTVKYIRADITLDFVMIEGMGEAGIDQPTPGAVPSVLSDDFVRLRQRLSKPGQPLLFTVQGIGNFAIQDGINYDVNNGPKPNIVRWMPYSNKAAHIIWTCSTWFADCSNQNGLTGAAQLPFSVSWNVSENGLLTRTISGQLEVPLSRDPNTGTSTASTALRQSADKYREQIYNRFPPLARFTRTTSWSLSPDRKYESFSITDTENGSDNPFFPGAVRVRGNRSYSAPMPFVKWSGNVSLSIEIAPGYSRLRAWWIFTRVFADIFGKRNLGFMPTSNATAKTQPGDTEAQKASRALITSISIDEDLYGRSFNIRVGYILFCSLKWLFHATGLFKPLDISPSDASWDSWRQSMSSVQSARGWLDNKRPGTAGGRFINSDDVIVDICSPTADKLGIPLRDGNPPEESPNLGNSLRDRTPEGVTEEDSMIHWENQFKYINEEGTIISIPLQKSTPVREPVDSNKPKQSNPHDILQPNDNTLFISQGSVLHRTRPRTYRVVMEGRGVRAGFKVPVPNLLSVGGKIARKIGRDIIIPKTLMQGTDVASGKPYTIYGCYWRKEYILEEAPLTDTIITDGHSVNYT